MKPTCVSLCSVLSNRVFARGPAKGFLWFVGFVLALGVWAPAIAPQEPAAAAQAGSVSPPAEPTGSDPEKGGDILSLEDQVRYFYALGKSAEMAAAVQKLKELDPENRVLAFYARQLESGSVARSAQKGYYNFLLKTTTATASAEGGEAAPVPPVMGSAAPTLATTTSATVAQMPPASVAPTPDVSVPPPAPTEQKGFLGKLGDRAKSAPMAYVGGGIGLLVLLFVLRGVLRKRAGKGTVSEPAGAAAQPSRPARGAMGAAAQAGGGAGDEPVPAEFSFSTESDESLFAPSGGGESGQPGSATYGKPVTTGVVADEPDEAFFGSVELEGPAPRPESEEEEDRPLPFAQSVEEAPPAPLELESLVLESMGVEEDGSQPSAATMTAREERPPELEEEGPRVDFGDFFARMGREDRGGREGRGESGPSEPPSVESPELSSKVFADQFHGVFLSPEDKETADAQKEMASESDEIDLDLVKREAGLFDPFNTADETVPETEATGFGSADQTQIQTDLDETFFHSLEQTRVQDILSQPEEDEEPPEPSIDLEGEDTEILGAIDIPTLGPGDFGEGETGQEETLVLNDPQAVARMGLLPGLEGGMSSDERDEIFDESYGRGCRAFEQRDYHSALEQFRIAQAMQPDNADVSNRLVMVQKALRNADTAG